MGVTLHDNDKTGQWQVGQDYSWQYECHFHIPEYDKLTDTDGEVGVTWGSLAVPKRSSPKRLLSALDFLSLLKKIIFWLIREIENQHKLCTFLKLIYLLCTLINQIYNWTFKNWNHLIIYIFQIYIFHYFLYAFWWTVFCIGIFITEWTKF